MYLATKEFDNLLTVVETHSYAFFVVLLVRLDFSKDLEQLDLICNFDSQACIYYIEFELLVLLIEVHVNAYHSFLRKLISISQQVHKHLFESLSIC